MRESKVDFRYSIDNAKMKQLIKFFYLINRFYKAPKEHLLFSLHNSSTDQVKFTKHLIGLRHNTTE